MTPVLFNHMKKFQYDNLVQSDPKADEFLLTQLENGIDCFLKSKTASNTLSDAVLTY